MKDGKIAYVNFIYCPQCGHEDSVKPANTTTYACKDCGWHFWNNAKTAAVLVFLKKDGTILIAERGREPRKGRYDLPGGCVDYNEDLFVAAAREAMEETGLTIEDPVILTAHTHEYSPNNMPPISSCDIIIVVTAWQGEPKAQDDVASIFWAPIELLEDERFDGTFPGLAVKLKAYIEANPQAFV